MPETTWLSLTQDTMDKPIGRVMTLGMKAWVAYICFKYTCVNSDAGETLA